MLLFAGPDPARRPRYFGHGVPAMAKPRVKARASDAGLQVAPASPIQLRKRDQRYRRNYDLGLYLQRAWCSRPGWATARSSAAASPPSPATSPSRNTHEHTATAAASSTDWRTPWTTKASAYGAHFRSGTTRATAQRLSLLLGYEIEAWFHSRAVTPKGWVAPSWPRNYGGMGAIAQLIIFIEGRRWGVGRAPDMEHHHGVGPLPTIQYAPRSSVRTTCAQNLTGEHPGAGATPRPNPGIFPTSQASHLREAVVDGDDFIVNGQRSGPLAG